MILNLILVASTLVTLIFSGLSAYGIVSAVASNEDKLICKVFLLSASLGILTGACWGWFLAARIL